MQRLIKFKNYRNIGLFGDDQYILLNRTMEKGKMGGLIIVIGPNNSGKSNVLDGICSIGTRLVERDITELSLKEEDKHPSVSMILKDNKTKAITMEYKSL